MDVAGVRMELRMLPSVGLEVPLGQLVGVVSVQITHYWGLKIGLDWIL